MTLIGKSMGNFMTEALGSLLGLLVEGSEGLLELIVIKLLDCDTTCLNLRTGRNLAPCLQR